MSFALIYWFWATKLWWIDFYSVCAR